MQLLEPRIRPDGLQISDNPQFQKHFWRVERVAWIVFAAIIVMALAGLTGSGGPFSERTAQVGGAQVTYTAITRWQAAAHLSIRLPQTSASSVTLELTAPYASSFTLDSVVPQADRVAMASGSHLYRFASQGGGGEVAFNLTARRPGIARYDLVIDGNRHTLTTLILP